MSDQLTRADVLRIVQEARDKGVRPDLREARLQGTDLRGADLRGADLRGALWGGLRLDGLPSGQLILTPTADGWHVKIGCWEGTPEDLADLLDAPDEDWPEARGDERVRREALLRPTLALINAHTAAHPDLITTLAEKWSTK